MISKDKLESDETTPDNKTKREPANDGQKILVGKIVIDAEKTIWYTISITKQEVD
jgi:hypothetical protein